MSLLNVERLRRRFGGNVAVDDVSFAIAAGELVGLIGPNGSGKTTVVNILSGHLRPDAGTVVLAGRAITGHRPDLVAKSGMVRMFQLTRLFDRISALDNLLVCGRALGLDAGAALERAEALLEELSLTPVLHLDAGRLSGGQRKLLEFGACFMVPPRVALLDEPFAAVHPSMREIMAGFLRRRHQRDQTFLLVSHDMPIVRDLCTRSICMSAGRVLADGVTVEVLANPDVIEAYLGGAAA